MTYDALFNHPEMKPVIFFNDEEDHLGPTFKVYRFRPGKMKKPQAGCRMKWMAIPPRGSAGPVN